jgi:hypothetical protein
MLRVGSSKTDEATWSGGRGMRRSWREIDRDLRAIAKQRGALDANEAMLLRAAVREEIWHELGKASLLEYLEDVLGYSPRAASERVRVARALEDLPAMAEALATGALHWSAVRELTRIVTPMTEAEWLADARGKNLRQIEQAVAGRKRGDKPTDPEEPDLRPRTVSFEVRPATFALLRQARQILAHERGELLDDDSLVTAMCNAILDGSPAGTVDEGDPRAPAGTEPSARARHQIMTVVCSACQEGFQDAGGRRIAISPRRSRCPTWGVAICPHRSRFPTWGVAISRGRPAARGARDLPSPR